MYHINNYFKGVNVAPTIQFISLGKHPYGPKLLLKHPWALYLGHYNNIIMVPNVFTRNWQGPSHICHRSSRLVIDDMYMGMIITDKRDRKFIERERQTSSK